MGLRLHFVSAVAAAFALGCDGSSGLDATMMSDASDASDAPHDVAMDSGPPPPVQVMMDFTHAGGFYTAPFPSEDRRMPGDHIDMHDYPNPQGVGIVNQLLTMIATTDIDGFGTTSGIMFELTGAPDTTHLPDVHASLAMGAPVFLVGVDNTAPDYLHR